MATLNWTWQAIADVDRIYDWISRSTPGAASASVERIDRTIDSLTTHPNRGRIGWVAGTRELVVPDTAYIVAYRPRRNTVELLGVIHGARRWPKRF